MTATSKQHSQRIVHSSEDPNWRTPRPLFDRLWAASGGFTMDLAADRETALVERWLGPGSPIAEDALSVNWHELDPGGRGFLNMPYSKKVYRETKNPAYLIENWVDKCYWEGRMGYETWALCPFSPQAKWYRRYVMGHDVANGSAWSGFAASEVWRLPHRVSFLRSDGTEADNAGHNVVVVIWRPDPGFVGPWIPAERYWSYR